MPVALMRTITSPGPGRGSGRSRIATSRSPAMRNAFILARPPEGPQYSGGVEPRPSSTVILARSIASEVELFMVRRHARARSFADAYVFPGGVVRPDDFADQPGDLTPEAALERFASRGGDPPGDAELALALHRAAARELFEEAGVLLAIDAASRPAAVGEVDAPGWAERRRAIQAGELTMAALLRAEGLSAALGQ